MILRMTQELGVDAIIRLRIRTLRQARGWSLEALATRAGLTISTLSRIETGNRRIAVDQLIALARALETTLDELTAPEDAGEIIIRPQPVAVPGMTTWLLSDAKALNGVSVTKIRFDPREVKQEPELRVHPGKEWFTVLLGEIKLRLGERVFHIPAGQAAQFETMTPHSIQAHGGPAEILSIMDPAGRRAHSDDGLES